MDKMRLRETLDAMVGDESASIVIDLAHDTDDGLTFSRAAMQEVRDQMALWVSSRIIRRYNRTNVAPSFCRITVTVDVG